ncbi:MAG: membrane protein insertase YidC, partial [Ramlibacter sp.]
MTDIRRTILWVIFGFSMVLLWDKWQIHNGKPATFFPSASTVTATATPPKAAGSATPPGSTSAAANAPNTVPGAPVTASAAPTVQRERFIVTTDLLRLTFDSQGGSLIQTELLQVAADSASDKTTSTFTLLQENPARVYVAESGLIGGDFPNHTTVMTPSGDRELKPGADAINVRFESPEKNGLKLVKTYTVRRGAYDIAVRHEVVNTGTAPASPQLYLQIVRDGKDLPGGSSFYSTFTGPAVYTEEHKYQKVKFEDIEKNKVDVQKSSDRGYVAMVQHYFASAWILPDGIKRDLFTRAVPNTEAPALGQHLYAVGMITNVDAVAPGASKAVDAKFFAGPQNEKLLERIAPGLDLVKDYGWLTILAKPLYWLLDKIHSVIGNWGWSIMGLVLLIKLAFYW